MRAGHPSPSRDWEESPHSLCILIPIPLLKQPTPTDVDALDGPFVRPDIEGSRRTYRHPSQVYACFAPVLDLCSHQVPGAKPLDPALLLRTRPREAMSIHQTHLPSLPARRLDQPGTNVVEPQTLRCRSSNGGSVPPMTLRKTQSCAVPARPSPCSHFNGKPRRLQDLVDLPPGAIDGGSIGQRCF